MLLRVTVPVESGNVITLSCVALVDFNLVSKSLAEEPSNTTASFSKVICDDRLLLSPPPSNAYTSAKFAFILVPAVRNVSPLPSFAELPMPIFCLVI